MRRNLLENCKPLSYITTGHSRHRYRSNHYHPRYIRHGQGQGHASLETPLAKKSLPQLKAVQARLHKSFYCETTRLHYDWKKGSLHYDCLDGNEIFADA